jgi:hypothetical protein
MDMQSKTFSALDPIEEIICGLLSDGAWKSPAELRRHIPEEAALACSRGSNPSAFKDSGAIPYGQAKLTREALSSLEAYPFTLILPRSC